MSCANLKKIVKEMSPAPLNHFKKIIQSKQANIFSGYNKGHDIQEKMIEINLKVPQKLLILNLEIAVEF